MVRIKTAERLKVVLSFCVAVAIEVAIGLTREDEISVDFAFRGSALVQTVYNPEIFEIVISTFRFVGLRMPGGPLKPGFGRAVPRTGGPLKPGFGLSGGRSHITGSFRRNGTRFSSAVRIRARLQACRTSRPLTAALAAVLTRRAHSIAICAIVWGSDAAGNLARPISNGNPVESTPVTHP